MACAELAAAIRIHRVEEVERILDRSRNERWPDLRINGGGLGPPPLFVACLHNRIFAVPLLLAHPGIDVMYRFRCGATSLHLACKKGHLAIAAILLDDPRVDPNWRDYRGRTPLWYACATGNLEMVYHLLASPRHLDPGVAACSPENNNASPAFEARRQGHEHIVDLLRRFEANSAAMRFCLQVVLRHRQPSAGHLFALCVLLCDDYLQLPSEHDLQSDDHRFFRIAARLPMEMQMTICNRAQDLLGDIIASTVSELALQYVSSLFVPDLGDE